ncbi:MAG: redoxin family protein [Gammaproteobacteria bacterium]
MRGWFGVVMALLSVLYGPPGEARVIDASKAPHPPEFDVQAPTRWINSPPRRLAEFRGKVVLVEFWTFACVNCARTVPWVRHLEDSLPATDFQVIGVHTPEFDFEKDAAAVRRKVTAFGLAHPVVMDNEFSIWDAWGNRYWPAFYLVDRAGRVRAHYAGETHPGDAQARAIEADIRRLLAE